MKEQEIQQVIRDYLDGKIPFKDERDLLSKLKLPNTIGSWIANHENRQPFITRVACMLAVVCICVLIGYFWSNYALPSESIKAVISHDLEFVRYRGNGLSIAYDNNLNETARAQLNLNYFYGLRIFLAIVFGFIVYYFFHQKYVRPRLM